MFEQVEIKRWECDYLRSYRGGWLLVYGRRKTGKTWLLRKCLRWNLYATVSSSGKCVVDDGLGVPRIVELDRCMKGVLKGIREGKVVVIDEFQRLPSVYWDLLSSVHWESRGLLVVCGSSLGIVRKVFDRRSPLLGLFQAFHVGLASVEDTIISLLEHGLDAREAILWSPLVRDPWLLAHIRPEGGPWDTIVRSLPSIASVARGLIGEVFAEEERALTRVYEAVLQLVADGVWNASGIAQALYNAGLTKSASPSIATGVLAVLQSIGLIEGIPLWKTRGARIYYRHKSSVTSLTYKLLPQLETGITINKKTVKSWYGLEIQFTLGELLSQYHSLNRAYTILPKGEDVDVVLLNKRRPVWGYEVKIGSISLREARNAIERARTLGIPMFGFVSLTKKPPSIGDTQLGPEDIIRLSRFLQEKRRQELNIKNNES